MPSFSSSCSGSAGLREVRLQVDGEMGYRLVVEHGVGGDRSLAGPDLDDRQAGARARPRVRRRASPDRPAALLELEQPHFQGVAFDQGVGGDVAELAPWARAARRSRSTKRAARSAAALHPASVPRRQPGQVVGAESAGDLLAPEKRRVADDGVEPRRWRVGEDLGEDERPVQRPAMLLCPRAVRRRRHGDSGRGRPCRRRHSSAQTPCSSAPNTSSTLVRGEAGGPQSGAGQGVGDELERLGGRLRLGQQPLLVLDVADRDDRGGGDAPAGVRRLGEGATPLLGEVEGAVAVAGRRQPGRCGGSRAGRAR